LWLSSSGQQWKALSPPPVSGDAVNRSFGSLPDGKNIFFNSTDPQPDEIFADHTS